MGLFGYVTVLAVLAVVLWSWGPSRRVIKAALGVLGGTADKGAEALNNLDPVQGYKTLINNAAESGKAASKMVESTGQVLESLERQIEEDEKEEEQLNNRLKAVMSQVPPDPNGTAAGYAEELAKVEQRLAENRAQLEINQKAFEDNCKLVEEYEGQVANARKDAAQLGLQLQQSEAEANLHELNSSLQNKLSTTDLAEQRQRVQAQIDKNRGKGRAHQQLNRGATAKKKDDDLVRQAAAQKILDRFKPQGATEEVKSES